MKKILILSFIVLLSHSDKVLSQTTPDSAKYFEGKTIVVCGKVTGTHVGKSEMTFINFGDRYPNNSFTALIAKDDIRVMQGNPPSFYMNKNVCVKGKIKIYKDKPELFIDDPGHLWIEESAK